MADYLRVFEILFRLGIASELYGFIIFILWFWLYCFFKAVNENMLWRWRSCS